MAENKKDPMDILQETEDNAEQPLDDDLTVEIEGEIYEFKYTAKRVETIERALGISLMSALVNTAGRLSIEQFKILFVYGLKKVDGPYLHNMKYAEDAYFSLLEKTSYDYVGGMISLALQRDCPFFFREG